MEDFNSDLFFTRDRAWDNKDVPNTCKFKKTFNKGKGTKEGIIINNRIYNLEFTCDKNTQTFFDLYKTLQSGDADTKVCPNSSEIFVDICCKVLLFDQRY